MSSELSAFVAGAVFNLLIAALIVRGIYFPVTRDRNYVFTFLAFNTVIYFVLRLMTSASISMGVGFGLFAIFSVLRYRTDEMPIREMTYLFIVIALPVMNSMLAASGDIAQVIVANAMVVGLLWALEKGWGFRFEASKRLTYDRIDLIAPARRESLLADLRTRTGLPIRKVEIGRIDFAHDTAEVKIFFDPAAADAAMTPAAAALPLDRTLETNP